MEYAEQHHGRIPPLILLGAKELFDNKIQFNIQYAEVDLSSINIAKIKPTKANNILIYFQDIESYNQLKDRQTLFGKQLSILRTKQIFVVLKGINYEAAKFFENKLKTIGIDEIIESKRNN